MLCFVIGKASELFLPSGLLRNGQGLRCLSYWCLVASCWITATVAHAQAPSTDLTDQRVVESWEETPDNDRYFIDENGAVESEARQANGDDSSTDWLKAAKVGYDGGFVIASQQAVELNSNEDPFQLKINGWGQLRHSISDSEGPNLDENQLQLKRARIVFAGHAFTPDFSYFFQIDGRSSSGDDIRLLDYHLSYDLGRHSLGMEKGRLGVRTGKWKMPFTMARYLSGREFEFTDRSMASTFFDVNRSLAWGLYGQSDRFLRKLNWEVAIFNGLVTGGAETGSSGSLDDNFACSGRIFCYPVGEWGNGQLADLDWHPTLATRVGTGFAHSTIESFGSTEFSRIRVVDSGARLSDLLPGATKYTVNLWSVDASMKYRGWSLTLEYYFRMIDSFQGMSQPDLYDHGHWLQIGKFVVPKKLQLVARWSRVAGDSGTLGVLDQSSDEVAGGFVWYIRDQHAKFTVDVTSLNGTPISSSALGIDPGDNGVLYRSQVQFAF